jgi:PTH1 family peptidyl-tRNA hydrolase
MAWLPGNSHLYFIKPLTYMNLSGEALQELRKGASFEPSRVCVLHDELDLPFGTIRIKCGGGLAGHNGLKSISEVLGSRDFFRIRIGIGRPEPEMDVAAYVLQRFSPDEQSQLGDVLVRAGKLVRAFCDGGMVAAQAEFH